MMFTYYKDLFGKLYLKKGTGPIERLSTFGFDSSRATNLRPPGGFRISREIFLKEISDEEFFDVCRGWTGKQKFG